MENPELHSVSDFKVMADITMQNSRAETTSPCFTPLSILICLDTAMSVFIAAVDFVISQL